MAQIDHKHPTMTLYLVRNSIITHWLTIVLSEKNVEPNLIFVDPKKIPAAIARINPHGVFPLLMDQEGLVLYTPFIIAEYLEERFPHPPLFPIYPIMRAKCRQMIGQIEHDWYGLLRQIESGEDIEQALNLLRQALLRLAPVYAATPYFLSEELTLVDSCIAPVLWRLKQLNIPLTNELAVFESYQKRLFESQTFQNSLRLLEKDTH